VTPPSLGPRGEGWVIGQLVLIALVVIAPSSAWPGPLAGLAASVGGPIAAAGLFIVVLGALTLSAQNVTALPRPRRGARLIETGTYRIVRHPIYVGLALFAIGFALARTSTLGLVAAAVLLVWLDRKARYEESLLAERFPGYAAYARRTKRFIPGIY
jgi:protein-S-isoprenylcysteine O-methyltransferase Ste14